MAKQGVFIVFEGIDGSGKSTYIKHLVDMLKEQGLNVLHTSEPSRYMVGTFIKNYSKKQGKRLLPETEALLFAADRFEHVQAVIKPALSIGRVVVSDRYLHSSLAYQGGSGADLNWIREINKFAPKPDLAILLDIQPEFSLQRVKRRRTVFEYSDYLRKVRNIYLQFVENGELIKLNADKPKKAVQEEIDIIVFELLENKGILVSRK
jgi:dTMP kinase